MGAWIDVPLSNPLPEPFLQPVVVMEERRVPVEGANRDRNFEAISDWLIDCALGDIDLEVIFLAFCRRLHEAGMPLMRAHLATRSLHPMFVAGTYTWERGGGINVARIQPEGDSGEDWKRSPLSALIDSGKREARHHPTAGGDWHRFPLLVELEKQGATEYFAMVVVFGASERALARRDGCIMSWASDRAGGFSDEQIEILRRLGTRFGILAKLDRREQTAHNIVSAYLGADAGRRVLEGQIRLGDGEVIPAVIWYSDLRGSTALADRLPGDAFLGVLNSYFQCTAGAVLDHGGEVLRFIGDAVLAIFPIAESAGRARASATGTLEACRRAIKAASAAAERVRMVNESHPDLPPLRYGIGLHLGTVTYGNIGIPQRLEFTVIGSAANEAARVESMTKELQKTVLVSAAFADKYPGKLLSVGRYRLKGLEGERELFTLPDA